MSCMSPSAPDAETALALYEDSAQITACTSRPSTPLARLAVSTRLEYGASIFTALGVLGIISWHGMTNGVCIGSATALAPIQATTSAASHGVVFMVLPCLLHCSIPDFPGSALPRQPDMGELFCAMQHPCGIKAL